MEPKEWAYEGFRGIGLTANVEFVDNQFVEAELQCRCRGYVPLQEHFPIGKNNSPLRPRLDDALTVEEGFN